MNKSILKERCIAIIQERMDGLNMAMKSAQDAANQETKSSSGDKYETARAMNQLEKDMYARQLIENKRELSVIMETDCNAISSGISSGSFIKCGTANFFILAGLGKINYEGDAIYVISPNAPLAKSMLGKRIGDTFLFNKQTLEIEEIL
jgi:hypothetical protein